MTKTIATLALTMALVSTASSAVLAKGTSTSTSTATVVDTGGSKPVSGMGLGGSKVSGADLGRGL